MGLVAFVGRTMACVRKPFFPIVSGVLWERCVTFWGPETVIEQETRITAMLAEGRGRDAALYIENIYHHYCDAHPNE